MILPWQTEQWRQLMHAHQQQRLPHALLFAGMPGLGKVEFAKEVTRGLLCQQMQVVASDVLLCAHTCHACRLLLGRAHPNVLWIEPEKSGQAIKVDQIRAVTEFISQSSMQGEYRVAIIHPANAMNVNAANALLKTLEEPSSGAILILISDQSARLPATILSRCQRIMFTPPTRAQGLSWLANAREKEPSKKEVLVPPELLLNLANGAPLAALALAEDEMMQARSDLFTALLKLIAGEVSPIKAASQVPQDEILRLLDFVLAWTIDLLKLQWVPTATLLNQDYSPSLMALADKMTIKQLTHFLAHMQKLRAEVAIGFNLNKQLILENVFIRWLECA